MITDFYKDRKVLVTGGTGTIGIPLIKKLINLGANVTVVSIDSYKRAEAVFGTDWYKIFIQKDLRNYENCLKVAKDQDYIFHLIAVKGCTTVGTSKVASSFVPFILCNTNMMEAAFRCGIKRYLFVGSICEYPNIEGVRHEDDMWKDLPEANDRYTGIAKRTGEAQAETYLHEYGWNAVRIVRPANVYGQFDDFDSQTAQVIPALIRKMIDSKDSNVKVFGDGTAIRDFIYSEDVADGMILALEKAPCCVPLNLGGGQGYSIKFIAETIADTIFDITNKKIRIQWDIEGPKGDQTRILATDRAKQLIGFESQTDIKHGIRKTIEWYITNKDLADRRGRELHG